MGVCPAWVGVSGAVLAETSFVRGVTLQSSTVAVAATVTLTGVIIEGSTTADSLTVMGSVEVRSSEARGLVSTDELGHTAITRSRVGGGLESKGSLVVEDSELGGLLALRRGSTTFLRVRCAHCQLDAKNASVEVTDSEIDGLYALVGENPRGIVLSSSDLSIRRTTLRDTLGEVDRGSTVHIEDAAQIDSPWQGWHVRDSELAIERMAFIGGRGEYVDAMGGSSELRDVTANGLTMPVFHSMILGGGPVRIERLTLDTADPVSVGLEIEQSPEFTMQDVETSVAETGIVLDHASGVVTRVRGNGGNILMNVLSSTATITDVCASAQRERSFHVVRSTVHMERIEIAGSADGILVRDERSILTASDLHISGAHRESQCAEVCEAAAIVSRRAAAYVDRFVIEDCETGAVADLLVDSGTGVDLANGAVRNNGAGVRIHDTEAHYDSRRLLENVLFEDNRATFLWTR